MQHPFLSHRGYIMIAHWSRISVAVAAAGLAFVACSRNLTPTVAAVEPAAVSAAPQTAPQTSPSR
jgi:hypothetical protein